MKLARITALAIILAAHVASPASAAAQVDKKKVASGETQVVARIAGRELTLSELRLEMTRLGLPLADPAAERVALESLINRTLLSAAAREANLHRKPETMARMYAAQDQALADYYLALASQPAEPTREEIDGFIADNPTLFGARKVYDFLVLTLETRHFNEAALTPLFDEEPDFARLLRVLDKAGARRAVATATQSGAALPAPIREQLAKYSVRDNIVIRGENDTQIMKIVAVRDDATDAADWPALARRMLLEQGAGARAEKLVTRLKKDADIAYFRASAAPPPAAKAE